jgi:hypothetical protein
MITFKNQGATLALAAALSVFAPVAAQAQTTPADAAKPAAPTATPGITTVAEAVTGGLGVRKGAGVLQKTFIIVDRKDAAGVTKSYRLNETSTLQPGDVVETYGFARLKLNVPGCGVVSLAQEQTITIPQPGAPCPTVTQHSSRQGGRKAKDYVAIDRPEVLLPAAALTVLGVAAIANDDKKSSSP